MAGAGAARWIDLIDPTADELKEHLPQEIHSTALDVLLAPARHGDEPRPRIDSHDTYVIGVMLLAVAKPDEDRIFFQEIDFILSETRLVTVSKTPPGEEPFDPRPAIDACKPQDHVGMFAYHLVDEIAERYLDLIDAINDEIDELEDHIEEWGAARIRDRISSLRHDLLAIRRTLTPTRDAVHKVVDDRVELVDIELFPRDVELHFADAYDKLLRATEGLETSREDRERPERGGQEAHRHRLVPPRTHLHCRGIYGQNFRRIPELHWGFGYAWSWALIVVTTVLQLAYFRWKKWI